MSGVLYLVGTGPGDPELLTLKAARILQSAAVIAFPQKSGEPSMSFRIAEQHLNQAAELLPVDIPMEVDPAPARSAYDQFARQLEQRLVIADVAYLCEGDPLFYGSAMYLLTRLSDKVSIQIIPGVTSLTATAAAAMRPIASRNDVLKVLPAPLHDQRLRAELETCDAVAIIKLGRHFDRVRALLEETGHAQNAVIVEHASGDQQHITPLSEFASDARPYFATILCHKGQK